MNVTDEKLMCRVCHNSTGNQVYTAREMMFGYRDEFAYFQCSECGCLQICDVPRDLAKYYPESYWDKRKPIKQKPRGGVKRWARAQRSKYLLGEPSVVGKWVASLTRMERAPVWGGWDWVRGLTGSGVGLKSAILDVGCGRGELVSYLRRQGFSNLTGMEPSFKREVVVEGIRITNKELRELEGHFDFIMAHHSFEHMDSPHDVFGQFRRLLKPRGGLLVRIPVVSSWAWEHYGTSWAQLDAPRHLFLHSERSIQSLCERHGLELVNIFYDSTEFQFWASELYSRGISLKEGGMSDFSSDEIEEYRRRAVSLNEEHRGDQACFYIRNPGET